MKILLLYHSGLSHRNDPYISLVPTGLTYLHACLLEAGHSSVLANFSGWSTSRIEKKLLSFKPDMVGISQWTHNRALSLELAAVCKRLLPECLTVMGGAHATFCYEDILVEGGCVDVVVCGEGELTLTELAARHAAGNAWHDIDGIAYRRNGAVVVTQRRSPVPDLDSLPSPSRYFENSVGLDLHLQSEFIVTARGCPSSCNFCSSPSFWGRSVRFRSPQAIVDEILFIREKYGLIYFSLRDDTFTADRKRILEFCSLLITHEANILWNCQSRVTAIDEELITAMKRAGCECIQLGIESGSPHLLKYLNKRITPDKATSACSLIREIGINLSVYLISNIPGETEDDLCQTMSLLRCLKADDGYVSPLAYYPGTRLFRDAVAAGDIPENLFSSDQRDSLYVSAGGAGTTTRLLDELVKSRRDDEGRFILSKERIGYCYTSNVLASEWYRQKGDYRKAVEELEEITRQQPRNPWGWFLLGELYAENGAWKKARSSFEQVLKIVPRHSASLSALKMR
ncbi:MAG TPA: radical SAM protein [Desulfuromonadales bacterium]|nr:radical SAM protein [Desulfuromonadales bacterium]